MSFRVSIFAFLIAIMAPVVVAHQPSDSQNKECDFPHVSSREVDQKVKILGKPEMNLKRDEIYKHSGQIVTIRALLCGSGKVTNIKVVHSVSEAIDAKAVEASRLIDFNPAEKDGARVSTAVVLKYRVHLFRGRR